MGEGGGDYHRDRVFQRNPVNIDEIKIIVLQIITVEISSLKTAKNVKKLSLTCSYLHSKWWQSLSTFAVRNGSVRNLN